MHRIAVFVFNLQDESYWLAVMSCFSNIGTDFRFYNTRINIPYRFDDWWRQYNDVVVLVSWQPFLQRPPRVVIAGVVSWSNYIFFRNKNSKGMVSLFSLITRIQITMAEKKEFQYNSEDLRLTTSHETNGRAD